MAHARALDECKLGSGVPQFGNNKHPEGMRCRFNRSIMIHDVNPTGFILREMELAEAARFLQRIGTLPVEKLFDVIRMHMGTPQTMMAALQTM
jgi:hypothetical protein